MRKQQRTHGLVLRSIRVGVIGGGGGGEERLWGAGKIRCEGKEGLKGVREN